MKKETAAASVAHEQEAAGSRRPRAFIIDDDPLMAGLLARRLARRGIAASVYEDGERLLEELAPTGPAVLFTDLEMPRQGGAALIARARERGYDGLIVLVTASRENAAITEALRCGADLVLAKPPRDYDLDWLAAKVGLGLSAPAGIGPLRAALEHVEQGALVLDEECVPLCINRRARGILGVTDAAETVDVIERLGIAADIMEKRPSGIVFIEPSGPRGAVRSPIGVEVHEIGAPSGALRLVLLHDFSERRRLDDLQAQFAAYLSHRMRTPLTSVRNAVSILCGAETPLDAAARERFLDIGCRNIERLVSSLDEIQKAFMAEAGEAGGCRSLVRLAPAVKGVLEEAERAGVISGFHVHAPERTVVTSRARLGEFIRSAVTVMAARLECAPRIDCIIAAHDDCAEYGGREAEISIVLASRSRSVVSVLPLREYIDIRGGEAKLVLERLAGSLGAGLSFPDRETVRAALPARFPYDRELDLVQPLHLMLERARLSNAEFNLVSVRAAGGLGARDAFGRMIADSLPALFAGEEALVAQGDKPLSFALFTAGIARSRIAEAMEDLRERLARSAREQGDEVHPTLRWEISYHCEPVSAGSADSCAVVEVNLP